METPQDIESSATGEVSAAEQRMFIESRHNPAHAGVAELVDAAN
jgi:hypothetical protein